MIEMKQNQWCCILHPCHIHQIVCKSCNHITEQSLVADGSVRRGSNTRKCARWPGRSHVRRNTRTRAAGGQLTSVHSTGRVDEAFYLFEIAYIHFNQCLSLSGPNTGTVWNKHMVDTGCLPKSYNPYLLSFLMKYFVWRITIFRCKAIWRWRSERIQRNSGKIELRLNSVVCVCAQLSSYVMF